MKKNIRKPHIPSEDIQIKILAGGLFVFMILIIAPLFGISHYNFAAADDYSFMSSSVPLWQESRSVWKVFCNQTRFAYEQYNTWQGTYFSVWLLSSLLGFFSQNAYFVGTYLALGSLVACELFSFITILRKVLHADYACSFILSVSCISMQVLMTTAPVEAYFWFTGAVVYTFIYALTILLAACLVLFYHSSFSRLQFVLMNLLLAVLNIAIGGSNYITALVTALIYLFSCGYFFVRHHKFRFAVLWQSAFYLAAFILNVAAPGNMVRQEKAMTGRLSAIQSIALSLKEAAQYLMTCTVLPYVILGILLIPIMVRITKAGSCRYPFPAVVSLLSFGLFAAQFTPTIYALGITGAGRVQNLYRFSLFIFLYGNELYWIGWAGRNRNMSSGERPPVESGIPPTSMCWVLPTWTVGGILLFVSLYFWGGNTVTSYNAWRALYTGEARQYYAEYENRCQLLRDESKSEVVLPPFSVKPYLLYFSDIAEDPSDWVNQVIAGWYGKESIILQTE
ncbi:DUF6056 family protein [uncultured Acetatifactor sp.]|uniref:DUF6056 family protein n=1 Tax=uncultured Acetatifactor sp. TaxID=1671927 RepID=UPI00262773BC|nr:DUF6056 family protein [uncultured Acetatifactor sp.]